MKKILFVSFYELKEYLMYLKELFQDFFYEVDYYPLFQYAYDANDKLENYKEHFSDYIKKYKPEIIIWIFLDVPSDVFKFIKNNHPNIYFIMFNGDDPNNMNTETLEKAKIFDLILTPCKENIRKYIMYSGVKNIIFNPTGFNPNYFFPLNDFNDFDNYEDLDESDEKYKADISIYCFTLYDDPYFKYQFIPRKKLLDDIVEYSLRENKTFKIFGSPILREIYPDFYYGEIEYINLNKLFNLSKINICTHPFSNKELSLSDIEFKILASGGLLFMDNIKNVEEIFKDGENCIIMNRENYIQQIDDILNNYSKMKMIRKNGYQLSRDYSWDNWVRKVHIEIGKHFFSESFYRELYDIDEIEDNKTIIDYWIEKGVDLKHICFEIKIPSNFNHVEYAKFNNLKMTNKNKIFLHWFMNGKNMDYLESLKSQSSIDVNKLQINMEKLFELNTIFNKIRQIGTKKNGLNQLKSFVDQNPKVKLNESLDIYFNLCD